MLPTPILSNALLVLCRSTSRRPARPSAAQPKPPAASKWHDAPEMSVGQNAATVRTTATDDTAEASDGIHADLHSPPDLGTLTAEPAANDVDMAAAPQMLGEEQPSEAEPVTVQSRMCVLPEKSAVLPGPASGWQAAVAGTAGITDHKEDDVAADAAGHDVDVQDDMGEETTGGHEKSPQDSNCLQFFFMDALYEPAMVGTVVMVGKVRQNSEYVSACVCVKGMKQCLFVVPKPFVFQDSDGDIARCVILPVQLCE